MAKHAIVFGLLMMVLIKLANNLRWHGKLSWFERLVSKAKTRMQEVSRVGHISSSRLDLQVAALLLHLV